MSAVINWASEDVQPKEQTSSTSRREGRCGERGEGLRKEDPSSSGEPSQHRQSLHVAILTVMSWYYWHFILEGCWADLVYQEPCFP